MPIALAGLAFGCLLVLAAAPARAQLSGTPPPPGRVRPWQPPDADSAAVWAAQIRAAFRAQAEDSLTDPVRQPFDRVGAMAWRWVWSLGRERSREAGAVEAALDSLGLDVDLVSDPVLSNFHFALVRNPFRRTSQAMGVFLWWRGDRLLRQGIGLTGGHSASFRVWWNDDAAAPYGWGLIDVARDGRRRFHMFTLEPDGGFWQPRQWPGSGPDLEGVHETTWAEIDGDARPELIGWERLPPDSMFMECARCPARLGQRVWTERRREGFALQERRPVGGPYATFTEFVRALVRGERATASRLLARPAMLADAIRLGWHARREPGTWTLESADPGRWPRWLEFRFAGPKGPQSYVVRFKEDHGRWLIEEWKPAASDTARTRRPR